MQSLQHMLCGPMQGDLLSRLQDVHHVIRLLGKGTCLFAGKDWQCIMLSPLCQLLTCDDSIKLFAQVSTTNSQQCATPLRVGVFLCLQCRSCCMPRRILGCCRSFSLVYIHCHDARTQLMMSHVRCGFENLRTCTACRLCTTWQVP